MTMLAEITQSDLVFVLVVLAILVCVVWLIKHLR